MILVLVYWVFLLLITSSAGVVLYRTLKYKPSHPGITILLGCAGITILASTWALFSGLSFAFELVLIFTLVITTWICKKDYALFIRDLIVRINTFPLFIKILFVALLLMAAAKCASAPYLIDNESYYIQSIKWLDSYGFVKGLGNLHLFLNQNSGWHILQSAINFDFIFQHFNDLSGFLLVIANFYAFDQLTSYFKNGKSVYLAAGFFPVFNVLLFQFISAPSPDIAVYVCYLFVVMEFFKREAKFPSASPEILFIICVFAVYIKVISLPLLMLPLYYIYKERSINKKLVLKLGMISSVMLLLFLLKNAITSGYPFYPIDVFYGYSPDWKIPKILQEYIVRSTNNYAYFLTDAQFASLNLWELFIHWLTLPKLHGLFNKLCVVLVFIMPFFIKKSSNKKVLIIFYLAFLLQMLLLINSSPQYRFFLMYIIIGFCFFLSKLISRKKLILALLSFSATLVVFPLFIPLDLNKLTQNEFHLELDRFKSNTLIIPHVKTQYTEASYSLKEFKNFKYYSPNNIEFFWGVGDGPLPSVQEIQVNFFKENYHVIPQQRTENINDGFYSQLIEKDE